MALARAELDLVSSARGEVEGDDATASSLPGATAVMTFGRGELEPDRLERRTNEGRRATPAGSANGVPLGGVLPRRTGEGGAANEPALA